ncbi:MAG: DinB family protein [Coriobacteriia bacterium]
MSNQTVAELLVEALGWAEARVAFETAVADVPFHLQGVRPPGVHHSPWELLEHIRMTQRDILEFCVNTAYAEPSWPAEYWPTVPGPDRTEAWGESVAMVKRDLEVLRSVVLDHADDLLWPVAGGTGETLLREVLLVLDHNAYQIGQLVMVRQLLGIWG